MPLIELKEFNAETIEKIKAFDCEAIKSFYLANFEVFKTVVYQYLKKRNLNLQFNSLHFNDYLNDIYISLPYYDYRNQVHFIGSLCYGLRSVEFGGFAYGKENKNHGLNSYYNFETISLYYENDDGEACLITDFVDSGIVENDMIEVKDRLSNVENRITRIELTQENIMVPRLSTIESCYTSTYNRYKDNVNDYENMKQDITVLKHIVSEHSKILQKIS